MNPVHLPFDVARCPGGDCRLKENCKRFLANADGLRVVVMMDLPYETLESCGEQIPVAVLLNEGK